MVWEISWSCVELEKRERELYGVMLSRPDIIQFTQQLIKLVTEEKKSKSFVLSFVFCFKILQDLTKREV